MQYSRFGVLSVGLFAAIVGTSLVHGQQLALAPNSKPGLVAPPKSKEWHQWRGPNRDGISPEKSLLQEWPSSGPPLAWRIQGLGGAFSSVAISEGTIFTMGNREGATFLIALDVNGGKEKWATKVGTGDRPNCTPTVDGDLVYALSFNGDLLCAKSATGEEVWRKNFGNDFGGQMMSGWGFSESPLVDGDLLICTPGSQNAMLAALDKRKGTVAWTTKMPSETGSKGQNGAGYSSIVVSQVGTTKQYVQLVGRGVIGVSAKDGKLLWGYNKVANGTANIPTPIVKDNFVFCSSGYDDGGTALIKLGGRGANLEAQEVYYHPHRKMQNHHGGMILIDNFVYMGHGHNQGFPMCVEMATGEVAWAPGRGPGKGSAAVSYADGRLYFRYEDGTMALIEATPTQYNLKGQFDLPSKLDRSWSHPAISGGKLYLRDQDVLLCYDIHRK